MYIRTGWSINVSTIATNNTNAIISIDVVHSGDTAIIIVNGIVAAARNNMENAIITVVVITNWLYKH